MVSLPTESDLCELMDRLARREGSFLALETGWELYRAAVEDGLVAPDEHGQPTVARWLGNLIRDGRAGFRSRHLGAPETPPGVIWGLRELSDHSGFFLTASGRDDARETRRLAEREEAARLLSD